jgi:DNA integrity scanning protein DisA with diadenylate cyclase activity
MQDQSKKIISRRLRHGRYDIQGLGTRHAATVSIKTNTNADTH